LTDRFHLADLTKDIRTLASRNPLSEQSLSTTLPKRQTIRNIHKKQQNGKTSKDLDILTVLAFSRKFKKNSNRKSKKSLKSKSKKASKRNYKKPLKSKSKKPSKRNSKKPLKSKSKKASKRNYKKPLKSKSKKASKRKSKKASKEQV
jgi:hypothetical protein